MIKEDKFLKKLTGLENKSIVGKNDIELKGNRLYLTKDKKLKKAKDKDILDEALENKDRLNKTIDKSSKKQ